MSRSARIRRLRAARPTWTPRATEAETTYGGTVFVRAGDFVRGRAVGRSEPGDRLTVAGGDARSQRWLVDLGGVVALFRLAASLPVLDVRLTGSEAGVAIRHAMAGRTLIVPRNRLCAAVFAVPESVPDRPSGKRNQALRTALTAADRAGIRVRPVVETRERRRLAAAAAQRVPRLEPWAATAADHPEHDWWVAEDRTGALVGIAAVAVDTEWASLITLIGIPGSGMESHARYLLHHAVVRDLSHAGVRHLTVLDHSPLLLDPGPQHLQKVLGYRPTRLRRPRTLPRPTAATAPPLFAPEPRTRADGPSGHPADDRITASSGVGSRT